MKQIQYTNSAGVPHQTHQDEFLSHKTGSEWWYCTGILNDEDGRLFSFQFTLIRARIAGIQLHILMKALSDIENQRHFYSQKPIFFKKGLTLTSSEISLEDDAKMTFSDGQLTLEMADADYSLSLKMAPQKPPVWHCNDGVLQMGVDAPRETTYYWSYTNIVTEGTLTVDGKEMQVSGKAWFDKQGGTYHLAKRWTHWEWFSMRFFDNEEVMLFAFPQSHYQDGTYVDQTGAYHRLNQYTLTPLDFTEVKGNKFSFGWKVEMPGIKEETYTISPKMEGQVNLAYFELLADIIDQYDRKVGYCVVELLPGVYNRVIPISAFTRVE